MCFFKTIVLTNNNIDSIGCFVLAKAIPHCQSLTSIYLTDNYISRSGCDSLARVIPQCPSLTYIILCCNSIDAEYWS